VIDGGLIVEQGSTLNVFSQPAHEVTRSLLDDVVPQQLPAAVLERVRRLLGGVQSSQSTLLRLVFAGEESNQPMLSDVIRRFELDLNLLHGQIDELQGQPFGSLAVLARGAQHQLTGAIAHLRSAGVLVQEVAHV
jgi:D-methionine transport system ATP-binding protein